MLKLENTVTITPEQWETVILACRNPLNSWKRYDSGLRDIFDDDDCATEKQFKIGPNDHDLMMRLAAGGPVHAKYRRMIPVWVDITAPLYLYKELDTYRVGVVCNSCSTMHKIHSKEFVLDDFSHEHMTYRSIRLLGDTIDSLNFYRDIYLNGGEDFVDGVAKKYEPKDKHIWWQMIQLLPSSFNQKRTYMFNYEVLTNMYRDRKNHKLNEWHEICKWIKYELPYSEIITGENNEKDND